jgi:hypothetical protein
MLIYGGQFIYLTVWWFSRVHFVDTNYQLLDTKGEGKQSMLTSLSIFGDTSLEFSNTSSDNQNGTVSLASRLHTKHCTVDYMT